MVLLDLIGSISQFNVLDPDMRPVFQTFMKIESDFRAQKMYV